MRHYIIYQITNQINHKIYIGAHSTKDINDDYMSSSSIVKSAMKKYGQENFTKEVLFECESVEKMYEKEAELVNDEFIARNDTYNIKRGGLGGWAHWNDGSERHREGARKGGNARRHDMPDGVKFEAGSQRTKDISVKANVAKALDMKNNPEKYQKIYEKLSKDQKEKSSMKDRRWCVPIDVQDYNKEKRVFKKDEIPEGWMQIYAHRDLKKRKNGVYGKYWIYNPDIRENKYHDGDEIPEGWYKGRKMEYYNS